jgi:chemotaxis protein methyltransferase CheR
VTSRPTVTVDQIPAMREVDFMRISKLTYEHCGIDLHHGKQSLVAARLGKRLRELGLTSFTSYYDYVVSDKTGVAMTAMVDSLTTNHTSFFREPRHFELLRQNIFPALKHRAEIHLWSAACSSGEEPFSIAMTLLEASREDALAKVRIRATDISTRVLEKARQATYAAERFQGLAMPLMQRYLLRSRSRPVHYRFKTEVRSMINFEYRNLMHEVPQDYRCSVLFCRNLMIYFDRPTQQSLIERLATHIEPGGYLFIGHSESLNNIQHDLEYVSPATYRKSGAC